MNTLREQLEQTAAEIRQLFEGSVARHALRDKSPVLTLMLPGKLTFYAEKIVPVLLKRKGSSTSQSRETPPENSVTNNAPGVDDLPCAENVEDELQESRRPISVSQRPRDTLQEAFGPFTRRTISELRRRVNRLATQLQKLHATRDGVVIADLFPNSISLPTDLNTFAAQSISVMLDTPAGPKDRPDFTKLLWSLFSHVWKSTGKRNDRHVAQILDDAGVSLGPADAIDATALRKWRAQHPHVMSTPRASSRPYG